MSAAVVVAEFKGKRYARYSIGRRRGNGWETIAAHEDLEFITKQAEGLALTDRRAHRVVDHRPELATNPDQEVTV